MSMRHDVLGQSDSLRIDYTSSVSVECRAAILSSVQTILGLHGYYHAMHRDKAQQTTVVSATPYDPSVRQPLSDSQVLALLASSARAAGMTMGEAQALLARVAASLAK